MGDDDFAWAAELMEARRAAYERFSPVFWRPAQGVRTMHADFMRAQVEAGSAVALRSEQGFLLAAIGDGRYDVDDCAVRSEEGWATEGRRLLESLSELGPLDRSARVRVVTARQDDAKRRALQELGLEVVARWWVRALHPVEPAEASFAPVDLGGVSAMLVPAPPVYAPGGPVCILGDVDAELAVRSVDAAEAAGAVLAVVTRDTAPHPTPPTDAVLEAAGFDNVSEFYEGHLPQRTPGPGVGGSGR